MKIAICLLKCGIAGSFVFGKCVHDAYRMVIVSYPNEFVARFADSHLFAYLVLNAFRLHSHSPISASVCV